MDLALLICLLIGVSVLTVYTGKGIDDIGHKILVYIFFSGIFLFAGIFIAFLLRIDEHYIINIGKINLLTQWIIILVGIRLLFIKNIFILFKALIVIYIWVALFSYSMYNLFSSTGFWFG